MRVKLVIYLQSSFVESLCVNMKYQLEPMAWWEMLILQPCLWILIIFVANKKTKIKPKIKLPLILLLIKQKKKWWQAPFDLPLLHIYA